MKVDTLSIVGNEALMKGVDTPCKSGKRSCFGESWYLLGGNEASTIVKLFLWSWMLEFIRHSILIRMVNPNDYPY
jgi:hypothetical protein